MDKYINKFHKFKFITDAKKDIKDNEKLPESIQNERINDDFSNEMAAEYSLKEEDR